MLKEKVVIVVGGAGLLGKTFTNCIADNNGTGIIADIDEDLGRTVAESIQKRKPDSIIKFYPIDINSKNSVCSIIKQVHTKFGIIDALVNSAYPRNTNYGRHFENVTYEDFCDNVSKHLGGFFLVAQQIAEYFKVNGGGKLINISSIYGTMAPRFDIYKGTAMTVPVEYATIKSAIIQLTKYIAKYYKGTGIHANCISPGGIFDNQPATFLEQYNSHCLTEGMLRDNDINGTLLFLLSDASRFINGQNIIIDDGFCL